MLYDLKKIPSSKDQLKNVPEEAGVYVFWNKQIPIYIGKANNLKSRLSSYFRNDLAQKTGQMVASSEYLSFIKVPSEIEALLLEAELIWKFQPHYNSALKDDKHPLYIMITKEIYPRVIPVKRTELNLLHLNIFGPFPSSGNMRHVLKMLRPVFHYSIHLPGKKPCIYSQMGLCKPCPSLIENTSDPKIKKNLRKEYLKNVKNIRGVLSGKIKIVRKNLEKEMYFLSKTENFEKALEIRKQIARLDYITSPISDVKQFVQNPNLLEDIRKGEIEALKKYLLKYLNIKSLTRIECFDVAHLSGKASTASMVTFIHGEAQKEFYRHFRIRHTKGNNDVLSLTEVAKRRFKRLSDWGKPDLIIVDGGKTQARAFYNVFAQAGVPVVGLAKRMETIVIPTESIKIPFVELRPQGGALRLVQRMRNEAHRFARRYHHKLLSKYLIEQSI